MFLVAILYGCSTHLQGLDGNWILNNNSLMSIHEDVFVWYQNAKDTSQNYLKGIDVKILEGEEALDAIHVPEANKEKLLKTHTYYLSVTYSKIDLNGKDVSQQADGKLSEFAYQITGKNQMSIVNLNTNEQYTATRQEE